VNDYREHPRFRDRDHMPFADADAWR